MTDWNLFIDDERFPPEDGQQWVIARSAIDVAMEVSSRGMPSFISFDHDLGENRVTGHGIAKLLIGLDQDGVHTFPDNFRFYVHSQNPVGKLNIESLLFSYLSFKEAYQNGTT